MPLIDDHLILMGLSSGTLFFLFLGYFLIRQGAITAHVICTAFASGLTLLFWINALRFAAARENLWLHASVFFCACLWLAGIVSAYFFALRVDFRQHAFFSRRLIILWPALLILIMGLTL